jgi:hypothetical protein
MKIFSLSLTLLFAASITYAANDAPEIKNGNFDNGKQFWKGDGKAVIEKEGANKVWELKASERNGDEISQDIDMGKLTKIEITLRAKGVEYKGAGLRISVRKRGGGATFSGREVPNGEWKDCKMVFNRNSPEEKYTIVITPLMGKGSIQIDDVKVSAGSEAKPK